MNLFQWTETTISFWALVISIISLSWQILAALFRFLCKASLSAYLSAPFEISYNNYGPLLQLSILFRSKNKDAFIEKIEALLKNIESCEEHKFEASAFLEYRPDLLGQNPFPRLYFKESFSPFLISCENPEKVTILFYDFKSFEKMSIELNKANSLIVELSKSYGYIISDELVDQFNKSELALDLWNGARNAMYLKPGKYELTLQTYFSSKICTSVISFVISEEDFKTLQLNAIVMTSLHKEGQQLIYNSIYPKFEYIK